MAVGALQVCTACGSTAEEFLPGPSGRPNAACKRCAGLERHRFLVMLLELLVPRSLTSGGLLLDIAPSPTTTPRLRELGGDRYLSLDFDPAADGRAVDVRASLTALPLPDDAVDLMICYHVLEHVPDDAAAMAEIARVVRPGGLAVVQVPHKAGRPTEEDPDAPVEERIRRFGQADHVRLYGDDFETRLEKAGLGVERIRPGDVVPASWLEMFRLNPEELVWLVRPAGSPAPVTAADVPLGLMGALPLVIRRVVAESVEERKLLEARVDSHKARAENWRQSYRQLRHRLPVRIIMKADQLTTRLAGPRPDNRGQGPGSPR